MARVLALVSFRIYPTHMGGQKGVALFYRYLRAYADITIAASMDNQPTEEAVLERVLYPNKKIYKNLFATRKLKRLAESSGTEVIIAEHSYTGWLARRLSRAIGRPFIIHSHNIESRRFRQMKKWWWPLYHRYETWIHRQAGHSFFISAEDRDYAQRQFGLAPEKCSVVTYGIIPRTIRSQAECRRQLGISETEFVLLFNGTLDYEPNYDAVIALVEEIAPRLDRAGVNYQIWITGNRAPASLIHRMLEAPRITYLGYVSDVDLYYQSADLFLNPVANDTGVKTKLIEAIANNCTTVSTRSGAAGLQAEYCQNKLTIVEDGDWQGFVDAVMKLRGAEKQSTPPEFYAAYSWEHITSEAAKVIQQLAS